jgi:hypothetical protein
VWKVLLSGTWRLVGPKSVANQMAIPVLVIIDTSGKMKCFELV